MSQVSLYREAWIEFKLHLKDLMPWILGFGIAVAFCNFFEIKNGMRLMHDILLPMIRDAIENNKVADFKGLEDIDLGGFSLVDSSSSLASVLETMATYFITVAYMKLQPVVPGRKPNYDIADFFLWIWQMIKVFFASFLLIMALGTVLIVGSVLVWSVIGITIKPGDSTLVAMTLSLVLSTALTALIVFVVAVPIAKFMVVTPLFLSGEDAPLKASWRLSKGHCWSLFWNYLGLGWTIFLIFLVAFLVAGSFFYLVGLISYDSVLFVSVMSLLMSFMTISGSALVCIYTCIACRRMLQEQKAATPLLSPSGNPS